MFLMYCFVSCAVSFTVLLAPDDFLLFFPQTFGADGRNEIWMKAKEMKESEKETHKRLFFSSFGA